MAKIRWAKGLYDASIDGGPETFTGIMAGTRGMTVLADKQENDLFMVRVIDEHEDRFDGYEYRLELKQLATKKTLDSVAEHLVQEAKRRR